MNPYANAALTATIPSEGNPRRTEAWALTEASRRMAFASRSNDLNAMREAMRLNWRLWTIFQAELTTELEPKPGDPPKAPDELLVNKLTLCQFIDKHTLSALSEPSPDKMQVLIDINRQIAAGLEESLANENPAPPAQAAVAVDPPRSYSAIG